MQGCRPAPSVHQWVQFSARPLSARPSKVGWWVGGLVPPSIQACAYRRSKSLDNHAGPCVSSWETYIFPKGPLPHAHFLPTSQSADLSTLACDYLVLAFTYRFLYSFGIRVFWNFHSFPSFFRHTRRPGQTAPLHIERSARAIESATFPRRTSPCTTNTPREPHQPGKSLILSISAAVHSFQPEPNPPSLGPPAHPRRSQELCTPYYTIPYQTTHLYIYLIVNGRPNRTLTDQETSFLALVGNARNRLASGGQSD